MRKSARIGFALAIVLLLLGLGALGAWLIVFVFRDHGALSAQAGKSSASSAAGALPPSVSPAASAPRLPLAGVEDEFSDEEPADVTMRPIDTDLDAAAQPGAPIVAAGTAPSAATIQTMLEAAEDADDKCEMWTALDDAETLAKVIRDAHSTRPIKMAAAQEKAKKVAPYLAAKDMRAVSEPRLSIPELVAVSRIAMCHQGAAERMADWVRAGEKNANGTLRRQDVVEIARDVLLRTYDDLWQDYGVRLAQGDRLSDAEMARLSFGLQAYNPLRGKTLAALQTEANSTAPSRVHLAERVIERWTRGEHGPVAPLATPFGGTVTNNTAAPASTAGLPGTTNITGPPAPASTAGLTAPGTSSNSQLPAPGSAPQIGTSVTSNAAPSGSTTVTTGGEENAPGVNAPPQTPKPKKTKSFLRDANRLSFVTLLGLIDPAKVKADLSDLTPKELRGWVTDGLKPYTDDTTKNRQAIEDALANLGVEFDKAQDHGALLDKLRTHLLSFEQPSK